MSRDIELEQKIDAYVKGQLTEEQGRELWEELLKKPEYIELLNTEIGVKSLLSKKEPEEKEERHNFIYTLQNSWKWTAAAAAIALIVVAFNFFTGSSERSLEDLALNNINISENLVSSPVLRSNNTQVSTEDSLLNLGFEAALAGNISKAVSLYDTIIEKYPGDPIATKAYLNKGIIHFNDGNLKEAIASFKNVINQSEETSFIKEKGYWYLGNAYINTDSLNNAHDAMLQVYSMEGIYEQPAIDLLKKLDEELENPERDYQP
jgi:tetratricopeptide (TPR) repeat protein